MITSKKKSELEQKKNYLKGFLNNINERIDDWLKQVEEMFDFATMARVKFERNILEEKRLILAFLGQNRLLNDQKIVIDLEKPLFALEKASAIINRITNQIEPTKPLELKAKFDKSKILSALQNDFRTLEWAQYIMFPDLVLRDIDNLYKV